MHTASQVLFPCENGAFSLKVTQIFPNFQRVHSPSLLSRLCNSLVHSAAEANNSPHISPFALSLSEHLCSIGRNHTRKKWINRRIGELRRGGGAWNLRKRIDVASKGDRPKNCSGGSIKFGRFVSKILNECVTWSQKNTLVQWLPQSLQRYFGVRKKQSLAKNSYYAQYNLRWYLVG